MRYRWYLWNIWRYVFDNLHRWLNFIGHKNPRILILGSAPWMRTLNNQPNVGTVYYFSRSNRFRNILGGLYWDEVSGRIFGRYNNLQDVYNIQNDFCIEHNIALRDRIHVFFSVEWSSRDDRRVPIVYNRITTNQNLVVVSNGLGLLRQVNEPMQQIKFEDDEINQRLRNEININTRDYQLWNFRLLFLKSTSWVAGTRIQDWNLDVWNA